MRTITTKHVRAIRETMNILKIHGMKESLLKSKTAPLKSYTKGRPWGAEENASIEYIKFGKPKLENISLTVHPLTNGTVNIKKGQKLIAFIAPEVFTQGWAKHVPAKSHKVPRIQGLIPLGKCERIGLQTTAKAGKTGIHFRFILTPLETVKVIHIRLVINLPYKDWQNSPYQLGAVKGSIPVPAPTDNRLATAQSSLLTLGPSPALKGMMMHLTSPKLQTVLQDNRQWTPFLHAFMTRNEPSEPVWIWKAGKKKAYDFTLSFDQS